MIGRTNAAATGGAELSIEVTVATGAVVTATKGSLTAQATSVNNKATINLPEAGEWNVTATIGGETSLPRIINVLDKYTTTVVFVDPILNNNSWETISSVSDQGNGDNYWSIGDAKEINLNGKVGLYTFTDVTTYAFIIGFNHNSTLEGNGKIHFQFGKSALTSGEDIAFVDSKYSQNCGSGYYVMNKSITSSGGWEASYMRNDILGQNKTDYTDFINKFIGALPSELRNILKSVTKYTNNVGCSKDASAITATTDYLFLLSEKEVTGNISKANSYEENYQNQYAYYSAGNIITKYKFNDLSTIASYWLRSPDTTQSGRFVCIYSAGYNIASSDASKSYGLSPAFCV